MEEEDLGCVCLLSKKTCISVKLTLLLLLLSPSVYSRPPHHKSHDLVEGNALNHHNVNVEEQAQKAADLEKEVLKVPEEKPNHPMAAAIAAAGSLLPLDDLQLPDHLDGVRMEQDGHLNRDYHKEVIIGNHEEFEEGDDEEKEKKLREIFFKVDTDLDTYISQEELEEWIQIKVQEHFDESTEETERIFTHLDSDKDGFVSWEEFHVHFLLAKGASADEAEKQVADYDSAGLDPDAREHLIRFKFRWAEADVDPQDNKLTLEEFASFRHPEQSKDMLAKMVTEIIENLDLDSNDEISLKEFVALPPGEAEYVVQDSDKMWQEEREKEFKEIIDLNSDGKITKDELEVYMDPKNPTHSRNEAASLIQMADENEDGKLSLSEVLDNDDLFMGSKMVHTGRSFHDEF